MREVIFAQFKGRKVQNKIPNKSKFGQMVYRPGPRPGRKDIGLVFTMTRAHLDALIYVDIYQYRATSGRRGKVVSSGRDRVPRFSLQTIHCDPFPDIVSTASTTGLQPTQPLSGSEAALLPREADCRA